MDFAPLWDQLVHSVNAMPRSGLLLAALGAMLLGLLGSIVLRASPLLGRLMRTTSTLALMGILLLVVPSRRRA